MAKGGLKLFNLVLRDFRSISGVSAKAAVVAPLVDKFVRVGPPPVALTTIGASLAELLALIYVFHFWFDLDDQRLDRRIKVSLALFTLLFALTVGLTANFTVSPGKGLDRVVEGYELRPDVAVLITPTYGSEEALAEAGYDPTQVWTKGSVAAMQTALPLLWIFAFASFSAVLAGFIVAQRRPNKSASRRKTPPQSAVVQLSTTNAPISDPQNTTPS
jgi:hypothetical protein